MQFDLYGDLKIRLIYFGPDDEQTMFLYRPLLKGRSAVIPLSCAHKYAEVKSDRAASMATAQIINICQALEMEPTKAVLIQTLHKIQDRLDDLINMPPLAEKRGAQQKGTLLVEMDGKKIEQEVSDHAGDPDTRIIVQ